MKHERYFHFRVEFEGMASRSIFYFILFLFFLFASYNIIDNLYKNNAEAYVLVTNENYVIFAVIELEYL